MTAARLDNLDLMAPPIVKTIQQRSLIIGVIFAVISTIRSALARRRSPLILRNAGR